MADILLINPSLEVERSRSDFTFRWADSGHAYMPLFAIALAPYLKQRGFAVQVLDMEVVSSWEEEALLEEFVPSARFVGLTGMTAQVPHALVLSDQIKQIAPEVPIVWGGIHASLLPEQTVTDPSVDYVVVGEGEEPLASLLAGRDHPRIGTKEKAPDQQGGRPFLPPEELPDPDYTVIDMSRYIQFQGGNRNADVLTSRGCSSRCSFCVNTILYSPWRAFSAERSIRIIRRLVDAYDIKHMFFMDETFFGDLKRARTIIEYIAPLDLTWETNIRIDTFLRLDDAYVRLLRESGMIRLRTGAESASNRLLKILRKGITRDQIVAARDRCLEYGLRPAISFMVDLPDELPEEKEATLELVRETRELGADAIGPQRFRPYPGSEEYDKLIARGLQVPRTLREWAACDLYNTVN